MEFHEKIKEHYSFILLVTDTKDNDQDEYEEEKELKHSQGQGTTFDSVEKSEHMESIEDSLDTKLNYWRS